MSGRCRVEVDLAAVRANVAALRRQTSRAARLLAVVKADAYGHGAVPVAGAALEAGADGLGVFTPVEATALRAGGIGAPVLVLGRTDPADAALLASTGAAAAVFDAESAAALAAAARARGRPVAVHIKVDTGMTRAGVGLRDAPAFLDHIRGLGGLEIDGIFSHLAGADAADRTSAYDQYERFLDLLDGLAAVGRRPPTAHIANSAALIDCPEMALEMVRPGIAIYGLAASAHVSRAPRLTPALSWLAPVLHVRRVPAGAAVGYGGTFVAPRETTIAVLGVGYADGYRRALSNRGAVLLGGRRCAVAGRVSMDMIAVDVGDAPVAVGDEAVLIGRQGGEEITADEMARLLETITYEITCGIATRVPRRHM